MGKIDKVFIIYIQQIKAGVSKGCFINPYNKECVGFSDLNGMVLEINKILQDEVKQDKSGSQLYYHSLQDTAFAECNRKFTCFYLLEVFYTEHTSWQGQLTGTGCPKVCFKSVLDLLEKMNQSILCVQSRKIIKMRKKAGNM